MNHPDLHGLFLGLLLLLHSSQYADGIRWLALAKMSSLSTIHVPNPDACEKLIGLVKRQKTICKKHIEVMGSVMQGAEMSITECQHQFRNRRWNCSTVNASKLFGNVLNQGTREAAFVHALSSAGVAYAVTRACSAGEIVKCGCDRTVRGQSPEGFEWSGCSDNIAYGTSFSGEFVDARERRRKSAKKRARALMNLHNNDAGRRAIEDHMKVNCKCHGVSGSCELKTCWRAMPSFREVGQRIKEKFDGATEVKLKKLKSRYFLVPVKKEFKPPTKSDLVHLVGSPDFCAPDDRTGSLGTEGRVCNKTSKAIDGCQLMCCGRGYETRKQTIVERCMCKFHWCCYVKCKECERVEEIHTCKA